MSYILKPYDDALRKIYEQGFEILGDRTGEGTKCYFGLSTEYDISERIPVLTKRKIFYKSVIKEVLWYISGSHSITELEATGAKIWTPWKSNEFTEKHGFPNGSGGYIYGFNLIHFGADLKNPEDKGFNQLDYVINTLRNDPKSRQAAFSFWRPDTNDRAVLPACHAFYHFFVSPDENGNMNILNCHIFQRSNDYLIGVGCANLFTGALFTYMIGDQLGMKPGKLFHTGSHCHIYLNALNETKEYLDRTEEPNSPILKIVNKRNSIYDYQVNDFVLEDYHPLPAIKMPIAV